MRSSLYSTRWMVTRYAATICALAAFAATAGAAPSARQALQLTPVQKDVDYQQVDDETAARCKIGPRKTAGESAWVVESPEGLTLRMFVDSNGDNTVDQWRYFKDGLEVYRDIDSDFDKRADQFRWFHTGGSRWGIDRDGDSKIDRWKQISPEEVSAEAVRALATGDERRFRVLLLTSEELDELGLGQEKSDEVAELIGKALSDFRKLAAEQRAIAEATEWIQFSGSRPGVVPAGTNGSTRDLEVYENAVAVVETGNEHGQVDMGTLVRVGPVWRMVTVPRPVVSSGEELAARAIFFEPPAIEPQAMAAGAPSEEMQELLAKLERLDRDGAGLTSPKARGEFALRRAELLEEIAEAATTDEERDSWLRQVANMLFTAVQEGQLEDGDQRLAKLYQRLKKQEAGDDILAYIRFRQHTAAYSSAIQAPNANIQSAQEKWLEDLEQFVDEYPKAADSAEAMLQLATAHEFSGEEEKAKKWYGRVLEAMPDSPAARKAAGAKRRLESEGKVIAFGGQLPDGRSIDLKQLRGKPVVIQYWATWSEPSLREMAGLKDLVAKYGQKFAVIGVNLDDDVRNMAEYLKSNRMPWPQIHEEGGLDSQPANLLGILTVPTTIVVDAQGRVVDRNAQLGQLEDTLKRLFADSSARRGSPQR